MTLADPYVLPEMTCPLYVKGRVMDISKLTKADVDPAEIADTLAKVNRFAGRTEYPYSVAQHAVLVAAICQRGAGAGPHADALAFEGLHHDDTEAYTGDILGPLKARLAWAPQGLYGVSIHKFANFEQELREVIAQRFGLAVREPAEVKYADLCAVRFEQFYLQGRTNVPIPHFEGLDVRGLLRPLHWRRASQGYMDAHLALLPEAERAVPAQAPYTAPAMTGYGR